MLLESTDHRTALAGAIPFPRIERVVECFSHVVMRQDVILNHFNDGRYICLVCLIAFHACFSLKMYLFACCRDYDVYATSLNGFRIINFPTADALRRDLKQ